MVESTPDRIHRYNNSEQCEVSDPDYWAELHYGPPAEESQDGDMLEC